MQTRIMYLEDKSEGISGSGRIGRVAFSRTGATLYYAGKSFQSLKGKGFKSNYFEVASGAEFWISGPRKDGNDRLYGGMVEIDEDARDEYWIEVRCLPGSKNLSSYSSAGKHR